MKTLKTTVNVSVADKLKFNENAHINAKFSVLTVLIEKSLSDLKA